MDNATPFELWHGYKPDVSHFRVWGLTAYVHIQKDKRSTLHPHYEKCMFIGYPDGYMGWKFYNPTTKHTIISECTDFDERTPISSPISTPPTIQAHAPRYTAPGIEDTPEDNTLEAPRVLHPGGTPNPVGKQDLEPNTPIAVPQPLPDAPKTPPPAPEPMQSSIGIGVHLSRRIQQRPQEWWKLSPAQLVEIRAPGQQKSAVSCALSTMGMQLALCNTFPAPLGQTLHLQLVSSLHSLQIQV